jgi:Zn-finger nucleic acid-binding protein
MICPRCNKPTLEEKDRDGITIDICQVCRGIWLDRGELERLIAKAEQELEINTHTYGREKEYLGHQDRHDSRHSDGDKHGYEGGHHRKKSWLTEIFD